MAPSDPADPAPPSPTDPIADELREVVRDVLVPLVAKDDGEIELVSIVEGVAEIRLGGACAGCPGQPFTANTVVLAALRAVDPRIRSVRVRHDV